ncbi:uncharacterized protein LOC8276939 [Ricinus communis]|uniref:uncharacterized protein LOC8276939 n=1 Tax=Ricinus communis TaxID=3988 RepID=UPI0007724579|nr:uncharacterized protein LOC8276939 [Ricinus communis]|eukprot:XP_015578892.1 uncharacterized protein LOC8276939 [Ricinus communis]
MSPLLVFLLICFCTHACNARLISDRENRKPDFFKGVDKVINLHETSTPSEITSPISEGFAAQEREEVGKVDRRLGASTMEQKNVHGHLKEQGSRKVTASGTGFIISTQKDLQQTDTAQGFKRQERFMIESAPSDTEEAVKSNENDIAEDAVVMDYAQPHRKPPIHNEKA